MQSTRVPEKQNNVYTLLKRIVKGIGDVLALTVVWAILIAVSAFIALDHTTVKGLSPVVLPVISIFWAALMWLLYAKGKNRQLQHQKKTRLTRRQVGLLLGLWVILLAFVAGQYFYQTNSDNNMLKRSSQYFSVQRNGQVAQDRIDRTLMELTRPMASLAGEWLAGNAPTIVHVEIFSNRSSMVQALSLPAWSGGLTGCTPNGPIIFLPAENSGNRFTGVSPTSTPAHEAVHALMCLSVGWQVFHNLPLWFNEGVAEYESLKGTQNLPGRASNRLVLWIRRSELLDTQQFLSYVPGDSESEVGIFYSASFELVRFIVAKHGETALTSIIKLTKEGMSFDDAFENVTGQTQEQIYERWKGEYSI